MCVIVNTYLFTKVQGFYSCLPMQALGIEDRFSPFPGSIS